MVKGIPPLPFVGRRINMHFFGKKKGLYTEQALSTLLLDHMRDTDATV